MYKYYKWVQFFLPDALPISFKHIILLDIDLRFRYGIKTFKEYQLVNQLIYTKFIDKVNNIIKKILNMLSLAYFIYYIPKSLYHANSCVKQHYNTILFYFHQLNTIMVSNYIFFEVCSIQN